MDWPYSDGAVARQAASHDWSSSILGPRTDWCPRVACAIEIALADDRPMAITIGTGTPGESVAVGNDALARLIGPLTVPLEHETALALGVLDALEHARRGTAVADHEVALGERTAHAHYVVLRGEGGMVIGVISRFELASGATEELPTNDHRHRVRNMLAIVRSVARRTRDWATSFDTYTERFDGRLDAMARVQAMLASRPEGVELWQLVGEEALTQGLREGEGLRLDGPDVLLAPRAAEVLSLAIHELIGNAVEHGAVGRGEAAAVAWHVLPDQSLRIAWRTEREGAERREPEPAGTDIDHEGFGREVIEAMLPYELDARTEYGAHATGTYCRIDVPAEHVRWIER